jgi:hypothetical protein
LTEALNILYIDVEPNMELSPIKDSASRLCIKIALVVDADVTVDHILVSMV